MMKHILPLLALFTRSLRDDLRSKFPPIMRALSVLFVLLLVWGNQRDLERSAPGQAMLMILAMVNLVGATIVGLGSFSSAITEEKEDDTIGLLLMTRLNPLAILLGKSTARLAGGMLFIVVQIPFTMLCVTMGGVTVGQVLKVYAILAAYLAFLCNLCLLWSVVCRRTHLAVSLSFVSGLVVYVLPFLVAISFYSRAFMGRGGTGGGLGSAVTYMMGINPIADTGNAIFLTSRTPFTTHSILFHVIAAAVLFGVSWALFNRFCSAGGEVAPKRAAARGGSVAAYHGRYQRPLGTPQGRALAWKDFHFLTGGLRGIAIRAVVYAVLVIGVLIWVSDVNRRLNQRVVGMIIRWSGTVIFIAELGALAARIFGNERKAQTLGGLVGLPISTSRVIWHKVRGCLPAFIPSLGLWVFGWLLTLESTPEWRGSYYREREQAEFAFHVLFMVEIAFFAVLVAWLSLRMRRAPLLTGIGIMLFGNILAGVLAGLMFRNADGLIIWQWMLIAGCLAATVGMAMSLPRKMIACAAEE